nr:putative ribonuclease H-like domain-containing protein [Tanacetum cinerariifolium]
MYGLHQAPRAWYGTLSKYLLKNGFQRGKIDQTLFIRRQREDFILVQVYVDDIIFGSSNSQLCREFKALVHEKFQMNAMGELNFFLGLQVLQKEDGIFLSEDKYVGDILKKFGYSDVRRLISWQWKKQTIVATSTTEAEYVAVASCCGQVLWIQNQLLDYGHHFIRDCFEKKLISVDHIHIDENVADLLTKPFDAGRFQYLVCKLFPLLRQLSTVSVFLGFGLTFAGTSKFWGVLRILMISLTLIPLGEYSVDFHPMVDFIEASPLSPSFSGRIVPLFDAMMVHQGEGSGTPIKSHYIPSPEAQPLSHTTHSSSTLPPVTTTSIPTVTPTVTTSIRQYSRRTRIAYSSVPPTVANEPASPQRDFSQGEACPTDSGFIADQDRATIAKSSTLPYDSAPRVTSPAAVEGSMQQTILELTALCTSLQRQLSELTAKFQAQEERVKLLETREGVAATRSGDDAPIKGRSMDEGEAATERVSDDTEEMATVLTSMDAATVLASRVVDVPTGSGFISTASTPAEGSVPTGSEEVPTASPVFATATVVTPVTRRKGKEVKDFRGMAFEEVEAKFNSVWKQMEDFIPMGSKEEAERIKRKGINLEQGSAKKQKTLEEVTKEAKPPEEVPEEKAKEMMQLVPIEEVYVEALQVKHPIIDWKVHSDVDWKLYDSCGVHHVTSKDKEIFMLVEKDYPLRKGLALVMICYKLQVENFSQMANDLVLKIYKIANSPRQQ